MRKVNLLSIAAHWRRYLLLGFFIALLNFWPAFRNSTANYLSEVPSAKMLFNPLGLTAFLALMAAVIFCAVTPGHKDSNYKIAVPIALLSALLFGTIFILISSPL